jgi:DNA-directed RNA polymerase II subunit RPB2
MEKKLEHEIEDLFLESFQRLNSYSSDAIKHYEYFMDVILKQILEESSVLETIFPDLKKKHVVRFKNFHVKRPLLDNESSQMRSLNLQRTEILLPEEARNRGLSYCAHVVSDVSVELYDLDSMEDTPCIPPITYTEMFLFKIPAMLRSKYCHSSVKILDECWMDDGGYFIINGHVKIFIGQKVQRTNQFFIKNHGDQNVKKNTVEEFQTKRINTDLEIEIRSLRSDEKFRSTSTLYIHLKNKPPSVTVNIPFLKPNMPILILFRLQDLHDPQVIEDLLWKKEDGTYDEEARKVFSCNFLTEYMTCEMDALYDILGKNLKVASNISGGETFAEKKRRQIKLQIQGELLPHIGLKYDNETKQKKIIYITKMIQHLMYVYLGREQADNRDFDGLKCVQTCSSILGILIRQQFAIYTRGIKNKIYERGKKNKQIEICHILNDSMTRNILRSFNEGGVTSQRDSSSAPPSTVIQICQSINPIGLQSQMQKVSTSLPRDGKYKDLRGVSTTELFTFCPAETPEGQSCGLLQNLTVMGKIRLPIFTHFLQELVCNAFQDFDQLKIIKEGNFVDALKTCHSILFCNGEPIAYFPKESLQFILNISRSFKRKSVLPFCCSIVQSRGNVHITNDAGIVCFPLLRTSELGKIPKCMEASKKFGTEIWTEFCRNGVVEFIDATELLECKIAFSQSELEVGGKFPHTHMVPFASCFMGLCSASVPWSNHDQAPRISYQAGMAKQAISTPCTNLEFRMDIGSGYTLWYPQIPMAETSISVATKQNDWPMGENLMIAIAPFGGWSQEDSIIRNKGSLDRGSGRITHFQIVRTTCKKKPDQEFLENPTFRKGLFDSDSCSGQRGGANYSKIGYDGLPEEGTQIQNNDVIIGKVSYKFSEDDVIEHKNSMKIYADEIQGKILKRDKSVIFQCEENEVYVVDKVMISINTEGNKSVRIKLRSMRIAQDGDKMSSRHGQKGTIGAILNEEDLPFVASGPNAGMRPDAIINVHCINGRMTIGKLMEMLYSSLGLVQGKFPDATPFRNVSAQWAIDELMKAGYGAEETMINGITGETMKKKWFIGSCFYQFLKHMVLDKITARQRGPRVFLTRQPLDGRANGGGQRLGEMEKDALLSHGAAFVLDDRTRVASDEHTVLVCSSCGHIGESKENEDEVFEHECKLCQSTEFMTLPTTYCYSKLLVPELATCGIKVTHNIS